MGPLQGQLSRPVATGVEGDAPGAGRTGLFDAPSQLSRAIMRGPSFPRDRNWRGTDEERSENEHGRSEIGG